MKDLYLFYDVVAHARVTVSDEEYEKFEAMMIEEKDEYVRSHFQEKQVDILETDFITGLPYTIENDNGDEIYYF